MLNENFVILGFAIATLGGLKYLVETIQGKIKPNRVTFFLWALTPLIAFAAKIKRGVGIQSLMFSIIADGLAALPTIVKSFHYPETENGWAYLTTTISALLTLLTIDSWNFAHYGFPAYFLIVCLIIFSLVQFKLGKVIKSA